MPIMVGKKVNALVHITLAQLVNDGKLKTDGKAFRDLEPVIQMINGRTRLYEIVNIGRSFPAGSGARWVLRHSLKTVLDKLPDKARRAAVQEMKEGDPRRGQLTLNL